MTAEERRVLRYRRGQRVVHALLAGSFLLLLVSGLLLLWGPASGLAAGGVSRWIHRVAAIGFIAVPFVYLVVDREGAKELLVDSFRYDRDDARWLRQMWCYARGRCAAMPPQGRLNAGQKLHHAAVIVISAVVVMSGIALWFFKPSLGAGGTAWAAIVHDVSMLALTLLLVGHLYFTFVYGALSGMASGYVSETDARLEHAKWVTELERAGATVPAGQAETEHRGSGSPHID